MSLYVICPGCAGKLPLPAEFAGGHAICKGCRSKILIEKQTGGTYLVTKIGHVPAPAIAHAVPPPLPIRKPSTVQNRSQDFAPPLPLPRKRTKPNGLLTGLLIGSVAFAMLLLGVCLIGVFFVKSRSSGDGETFLFSGESSLPQTSNTTLNGFDVDHYGSQLLDIDLPTSLRAAQALGNMGDESLRWFLKGLKSNSWHVHEFSVCYLPSDSAAKYKSVFEPILIPLLSNGTEPERTRACVKLVEMKSEKGIAEVRRKANDPAFPEKERKYFAGFLKANGY
ncbi:MAG TPA: hypothetical protein VHR66_16725 [Gemmataceae bacterium]|jgi:hypothetical protein|nr:hypothetical protein [Gemmataceae bacterium]